MNSVNKTLYIPLYGKALVSRMGIILSDPMAEELWKTNEFPLKGKSKSEWLAYYMGMRSAVFDRWLEKQAEKQPDAVILHIGCGLDSRILRTGLKREWYDMDFPEVIEHRRGFFPETDTYHLIGTDVREEAWLSRIPGKRPAIVVMEGVSMYLSREELTGLMTRLSGHFAGVAMLMDCYTEFAAKASRYRNPINDVGVTEVYGLDDPCILTEGTGFGFVSEHDMTPEQLVNQIPGWKRKLFRKLYAGAVARKMYRMYEYETK